jgi:hypothetical protein
LELQAHRVSETPTARTPAEVEIILTLFIVLPSR